MYSYGSPHMAAQKQDDQHERTFSSYVRIQVVVLKTYLGRWTIGRSGERGSGISVLPARYDDDDDDDLNVTDCWLFFFWRKLFTLWILFVLTSFPGVLKFNILFLKILLVLIGINPYSGFTGLNDFLYIYIYIYIYICVFAQSENQTISELPWGNLYFA